MDAKAKTITEIENEIESLSDVKTRVNRYSSFDDIDYHEAIDVQMAVLQEDMDKDTIEEYFEGSPEYIMNAAIEARQWMDGEGTEGGLADGWATLIESETEEDLE